MVPPGVDRDWKFGSEEDLNAKVRALTAEVTKLRREIETTLRSAKNPGPDFASDRPPAQKRRPWRSR